jgi:asparagine synthase (glutamine-hydrolysing)
MCGVGGFVLRAPVGNAAARAGHFLAALRQRGPDDEGVALIDREDAGAPDVALAHTRYAIIDLSARAHQPFSSADGSLIAAYNGEIYNYIELRDELRALGVMFRTESDTEVLVEGYRVWGRELWRRLNGFWAVAMYDVRRRAVVFSRDRIGVAPLYFRETDQALLFASTIRPLLSRSDEIDADVARGFIAHGLKDFDGSTFYRDVRSMPAAAELVLPRGAFRMTDAERFDYWRFPATRWTTADLSLDEAAARVRTTLTRAVELRLRADVPVAFELSGGLDSSSIVAAAATLRSAPVTTYTISVPGRDEEPFARLLRDRYALDYHVLRGDENRFDDDGDTFDAIMEEPYHSPNSFTAWQMRRAMKAEGVAVVVSGSGGDETLAGYEYEFWSAASRELNATGARGHALRHAAAMRFGSSARAKLTVAETIGAIKRAIGVEKASTAPRETRAARYVGGYESLSFHERSLYQFAVAQLPYYLRNNDHLTMSIPLEHRFPFLDVDMVELGLQMPIEYLYRDGWSKYVLRRAMEKLLPDAVVWRREKMGFPFPLTDFLAKRKTSFDDAARRAVAAGFADAFDWNQLIASDPVRLWRIVSTGRWLAAA